MHRPHPSVRPKPGPMPQAKAAYCPGPERIGLNKPGSDGGVMDCCCANNEKELLTIFILYILHPRYL